MANRKWKKATVTYQGGMSYSVRGHIFKKNRPKPITDKDLAYSLEGVYGFSVAHEFYEEKPAKQSVAPQEQSGADEGEGSKDVDFGDPPGNVDKAKKALRSGVKRVSKKKRKVTE